MFDHVPVNVETFVESPHYMDAKTECWPRIKDELIGLFNTSPLSLRMSDVDEFIFKAGIGAGKSYFISILFSYITYRLLCFKNPQRLYGLARGSKIALVNMSKTGTQAKKVVFSEISARIENSPWFQNYCIPDPDIKSELRFTKGILILPGNSEETFPLGFNVFAANLDEAAFFSNAKGHDVADEIYHQLQRRMTSRFRVAGVIGITSSPRYVDDFIERKAKEAEKAPHIKLAIMETWATNPKDQEDIKEGRCFELDHPIEKKPVKIPIRYKYDFDKNPEKAWRDFGGVPSKALEPYIRQINLVKQCEDKSLPVPMISDYAFDPKWEPERGTVCHMHIDLALSKDACGIAMAFKKGDRVVVNLIHCILAPADGEIDITAIKDLIIALKVHLAKFGCRLGKVTYDQFQSASSIQQLKKKGIESERLSVDKDLGPYETLKELCNSDNIRFQKHVKFFEEMERLELIEGKKVDHPPKGSKDVSDAVAGAVFNAVTSKPIGRGTMTIV